MSDLGASLLDYGVGGFIVFMAWINLNHLERRDKRDAVSHAKNTETLAKIAEEVTEAYKQVGERLGENSEALRDVKSELRRRES